MATLGWSRARLLGHGVWQLHAFRAPRSARGITVTRSTAPETARPNPSRRYPKRKPKPPRLNKCTLAGIRIPPDDFGATSNPLRPCWISMLRRAQPPYSTYNAASRLRKPDRDPSHARRRARSRASRHVCPARVRIDRDANGHGDRRRSGPYRAQVRGRLLEQYLPKMPSRQLLTKRCLPSPSIHSPSGFHRSILHQIGRARKPRLCLLDKIGLPHE